MSVEDWASEEARGYLVGQFGFKQGIVHAFSALLSDEVCEAAAITRYSAHSWRSFSNREKKEACARERRALQAAVDAVTKGDTE